MDGRALTGQGRLASPRLARAQQAPRRADHLVQIGVAAGGDTAAREAFQVAGEGHVGHARELARNPAAFKRGLTSRCPGAISEAPWT